MDLIRYQNRDTADEAPELERLPPLIPFERPWRPTDPQCSHGTPKPQLCFRCATEERERNG